MFSPFKGGVHPSERKQFTDKKNFSSLAIPHLAYIPLKQHIGSPAKPIVSKGDVVKEGDLLAEADGVISANIHSSVPGQILDLKEIETIYGRQPAFVIEVEGSFAKTALSENQSSWLNLSEKEILQKIKEAGIVGLGGAAFPTNVKLSPPPEKKIEVLIVNGAECEPYLTVDDLLMQSFASEIIEGIRITLKVLKIKKAIIGIEKNKPLAINSLRKILEKNNPSPNEETIEIKPLKTRYPQGAEKQLIYSLLKKEIPSRKLPMDIGVVVQNIGTIYAIYQAVVLNKPLYERYLTISGEMINNPGNYKVRIGTTINDLIKDCDGLKGDPVKIVVGGPLCGLSINDLEMPVVKGFSGVLFLSSKEARLLGNGNCIRCGKCVATCPMGLVPSEISEAVENNFTDSMEKLSPFECIKCGACSYVCPAGKPLSHFVLLAQEKLNKLKKNENKN